MPNYHVVHRNAGDFQYIGSYTSVNEAEAAELAARAHGVPGRYVVFQANAGVRFDVSYDVRPTITPVGA